MKSPQNLLILIAIIFCSLAKFAFSQNNLATVLKADKVSGNKEKNTIEASGNVEVSRGQDFLFSDKLTYDKNTKIIQAVGNIKFAGDKISEIYAKNADIKDDFTTGSLQDGQIIFNDGSYAISPYIKRESKTISVLQNSIFSFCPNSKITTDHNNIEDDVALISVKSKNTTIDKADGYSKLKYATLRVNDVPIFYTPYLSFPLKSTKRRSGFLNPSYTNTGNLGFGLVVPYYFNIAPEKDLTTTAQYHPSGSHLILNNNFRHLTKNGRYNLELENANNNLANSAQNSNSRWLLRSKGNFKFSKKLGLEVNLYNVGDKNYLREYHNDFVSHTVSEINLNHIENNNYKSLKAVKIQELEVAIDSREEVRAIPIFNSYLESKAGKLQETYSLQTNATAISRRSGLQYRRLTLNPEITVPYNISGNIFKLSTAIQGDFYNLYENYTSTTKTTEYDKTEFNYRPQAALSWTLPLIKKTGKSSFILEPKIQAVVSSYDQNQVAIPNEDSVDTELTRGNLFLKDRFVGFDRNESGQRIAYGFNSNLFNSYGKLGLGLGQGYRKNYKAQDVVINGFNDSISNIVGEISYASPKIFSFLYNFQLNESDYGNDVNELNANFKFDNFEINANYLLTKKTNYFNIDREQISAGVTAKIYGNLTGYFDATKDLITNQVISKKIGLNYDGCCVVYGVSASEYEPTNFTSPNTSYNINFSIKNL